MNKTTTIIHPRLTATDEPVRPAWQGRLAVVVLAVLGFSAAFSHVWDSDVPWHLACGEWMLRHGQIMGHDYFSVDPQALWVNVHWLFQVIVAAVHSVAGDTGLSLLKGLVCAGGLAAFGLALRRHVPSGWLIFAGMLMLYVFQSRIRVRPELFTLALLIVTIALADSVRRGASPNRLWFMVPIMLFWVNMHGLFFLGLAILWGFVIGGFVDAAWGRWSKRGTGVPPVPHVDPGGQNSSPGVTPTFMATSPASPPSRPCWRRPGFACSPHGRTKPPCTRCC